MNRSLANVLFGAFGAGRRRPGGSGRGDEGKSYREVSAEDCAVMLAYASRVVVVPGYGLAVARRSTTCASWPTCSSGAWT